MVSAYPYGAEETWGSAAAASLVGLVREELAAVCPGLSRQLVGMLQDDALAADLIIAIEHPKIGDLQLILELSGDRVRIVWTRDHIDDEVASIAEAGAIIESFPADLAAGRVRATLRHELRRKVRSTIVINRHTAYVRHELESNSGEFLYVAGLPRPLLGLVRLVRGEAHAVVYSLCEAAVVNMPAEERWARPMPEHLG